jgi:ABC-type lipoprotein release transport system permease subunit
MVCFLIVSTMVMGVTVYLDSVSMHTWNRLTDVGPHAMIAHGEDIENHVSDIENLPHVTKAAFTQDAIAFLRMDQNEVYQGGGLAPDFMMSGRSYGLSQDYVESFPSVFNLLDGRFPETELEIAIPLRVADTANVWLGAQLNFSHYLNGPKNPVFVVGVYVQEVGSRSVDYYYDSIGVVLPSLLNPEQIEYRVYLDVERNLITSFDPLGSLSRLDVVKESILGLYPGYPEEIRYSEFYVSNHLAAGVEEYVDWLNTQRIDQLARGQILILLASLLALLIVRYNFNERVQEIRFLLSRGASSFYANRIVYGDLLAVSMLASPLAIILGAMSSRIAISSVGFMVFSSSLFLSEPLLISLDTVITSLILGAALPTFGVLAYHILSPKEKETEKEPGRIARLTKGVRLIRWDLSIVLISSLLMAAIYVGGTAIRENPFILAVQPLLPIPVFLGIASLTSKAMSRAGSRLSGPLSRVFGKASASIGARRAGQDTSMTGPYTLVLALTLVLVINSAATSATLPNTQLKHTQFAVGADITFRLSRAMVSEWSDFALDVNAHALAEDGAFVATGTMYLSEGSQGSVSFIGVSPQEYSRVGYDHTGTRLEDSYMNQYMVELATSPTGVLISEDIAQEFQLQAGDTLRAFSLGTDGDSAEFNVIAVVPAAPAPMIPTTGSQVTVGLARVILNIDYIATKIDLVEAATNYYCVRTAEDANSTILVEELSQSWGADQTTHAIIYPDYWAGVSQVMDTFAAQPEYTMDRAIDSMVAMMSVGAVLGAATLYEVNLKRTRKREVALLKALGARSKNLLAAHLAEIVVLTILGVFVLIVFGPIFVANSLELSLARYRLWSYSFPNLMYLGISWTLSLAFVGVLCITAVAGSLLLFPLLQRFRLRDGLESTWTETSLSEVTG